MKIIEIVAQENGSHRNQNGGASRVPDGWAVIPDGMEIPATFPFVDIEVDGQTVVKMTAGVMPEQEPEAEEPTEYEQLRADVDYLLMLGGG